MNRLIRSVIAMALASISGGVLADDGVEGVREQAKATYEMDKKSCGAFEGDERERCRHRAKAQYDQAMAEARKMKAERKEEKRAERAERRDTKRRLEVGSGGERAHGDSASGASNRPAAGAQSASERSAEPAPGKNMGRAPVTAGGSPSN